MTLIWSPLPGGEVTAGSGSGWTSSGGDGVTSGISVCKKEIRK